MEMFATNEELERLEQLHSAASGPARLAVVLSLAWYLCQRDSARVPPLLEEAQTLLYGGGHPVQCEQAANRIDVVRAHLALLAGRLQEAHDLAQRSMQEAQQLACWRNQCDAGWILAQALADFGDLTGNHALLQQIQQLAAQHDDMVRADFFEIESANWFLMRDLDAAQARWGHRWHEEMAPPPPGVAMSAHTFVALQHFRRGNFGASVKAFVHAYDAGLSVGILRRAILCASNIGYAFARLNDHQSALEWKQRALDLARQTHWPGSIGACLVQTSETLRQMGQLDAARQMMSEALQIMAAYQQSRNYAIALGASGDLSLEEKNYQQALDTFTLLERRAEELGHQDFHMDALRGQAHALSWLGQGEQARARASAAQRLAARHNDAYHQIEALKVLADVYSRHALASPEETGGVSAAMYYLQQALAVAATIDGYAMPPEVLDALAREYARAKQHGQAYATSLQAIAAREKRHSQQATNRAIAMQVRYQTERARAEGEYHRKLAAAEARRAATLQDTGKTLERLSAIGQEVTAQLDVQLVFQTLYRHVQGLLDVNGFAVYLSEADGQSLARSFGMEGGVPLPGGRVLLANPNAASARCAREKTDLVLAINGSHPAHLPGTMCNRSALFAPLMIGERVLGVMSVQSLRENAFGERERNLFRSLCAYAAIAIDNAHAYAQLQETQNQLVEQEKLVALGSLVAGVAHELNTPLGNSLIIASALQMKTLQIEERMQGQAMRAAELQHYLSEAEEAAMLIVRGLRNAADLVNSFKQVAVDRTAARRRVFDLQQTCNELLATLNNQIRPSGHELLLDAPPSLSMDSYPGPLGQVLSNLIANSLMHAFADGERGVMRLTAHQEIPGEVVIEFSDNGCGIPAQNLGRIFDPFFTTRMGQGGNGLGLFICYNIVTSLLQGSISVRSAPGQGTRFVLILPQIAQALTDSDVEALPPGSA
ncbi:ATP-binding protein [Massilia sp. W12]|uniref:ATP-binding protein n=1 Tax=Massilia sp. W12 TaxID=3126507 RepID=UPI0030D38567